MGAGDKISGIILIPQAAFLEAIGLFPPEE
jgi:hypothetical protein